MATFDSLINKLQTVSIEEVGVSFAGQVLKLNDANDAKVVCDKIRAAEKVEFLNMEGNSLGVEAAEVISRALETRKEFKKAYWKDMFTGRLKNEIPKALKHLGAAVMKAGAELEVLDLSDNASGPIGVEGFEDLLRSPSCYTLKELRLNNMGLGITGAKKLAKALQDLVTNSKKAGKPLMLKVFVAGRNRLENEGATALARVFERIGSLETIVIPQNGIYHTGITALCEAFKQNPNLRELNLNDNTITVKGAKALANVLPTLTALRSLDFGDCLLRNQGGLFVAQALPRLTHLETLNLSANEMKASAGLKVINALQHCQKLTSVNLSSNQFGPENVDQFNYKAKEISIPLTMSDDEGDDEDNEDDEDEYTEDGEEEEEEEEGEEEEDEENYEDDDYNEEVDEILSGSESETDDEREVSGISPLRPAMILVDCTVKNFTLLRDPVNEIVHGLKQKVPSDSLAEEMMSFIVKMSGLTGNDVENTNLENCVIGLYKELTRWASAHNSVHVITNRLPVHLGYIKDEATNKKRVVANRPRCLSILHKAISSSLIPESSSTVIRCLEAQPDSLSNGI